MDIMKIARLIEEISYDNYTRNYKEYCLHQAISEGTITEDQAVDLRIEYCNPARCEDPYNYDYTAVYHGHLFEGDVPNAWNEHGFNASDAQQWDWIHFYGQDMEITVYDNETGITYDTITKEWS